MVDDGVEDAGRNVSSKREWRYKTIIWDWFSRSNGIFQTTCDNLKFNLKRL